MSNNIQRSLCIKETSPKTYQKSDMLLNAHKIQTPSLIKRLSLESAKMHESKLNNNFLNLNQNQVNDLHHQHQLEIKDLQLQVKDLSTQLEIKDLQLQVKDLSTQLEIKDLQLQVKDLQLQVKDYKINELKR